MAITVTTPTITGDFWCVNATSADASGCEELKAAPAAGTSLYIHYLVISCVSAITVTIGEGETTSAPDTNLIGPIPFATGNGSPVILDLHQTPIKLTAAKNLVVDASGAGAVTVFAIGKTL